MSGPVLVIGAGVWVLCQVFGGNALGRLGLFTSGGSQDSGASIPGAGAVDDAVGSVADKLRGVEKRATKPWPPTRVED